ncbi:MFS transporter [Streptomyces sp. NPDC035033]|uniref:MFS transporter n=1 Tax=Streptomyces sp. NPDC035033 TaxID=3155368 RepID=UPI0033C896D0
MPAARERRNFPLERTEGAGTLDGAERRDPVSPPSRSGSPGKGRADAPHRLTVLFIFLVFGSLSLGMGLVPALITTFGTTYGLDGSQLANVQNLKDIGLVAAMFSGPVSLRRLGGVRTMMLSLLAGILGCAVLILSKNYLGVLAGAFLHGAAFSLGSLAAVTHLFRLPQRYHRIAGLSATFGVASFVAPSMVGALVAGDGGYEAVYVIYACALVAPLAGGVLLDRKTAARERDVREAARPRLNGAVLRGWLPDIVVYATLMAVETVVVSWITSLAQYRYGFTLADASFLLALLWMVHTPSRAIGDVLAAHLREPVVMLLGVLLILLGNALICAGPGLPVYAGTVVFAFGTAPLVPVFQGWALTRSPAERHGQLSASLGVGAALLTTVMVWLTGITMDLDARLPFVVSAVGAAGLAVWAARRTALVKKPA